MHFSSNDPGFKRRYTQFDLNTIQDKQYYISDIDMLSKSMIKMLINKCKEVIDHKL